MAIVIAPAAQAATYYWDNNGATAGFGTAAGTWAAPTTGSGTQGWSADNTGGTLPTNLTTTTSDALNFGAGTGLSAGTITISGTVNAGDLTFASGSGAIVLSGGMIHLATSVSITLNNAADTIGSSLRGGGTSLTKAGTGALTLGINSTSRYASDFTGVTTISAGLIKLTGWGSRAATTVSTGLQNSPYDTTGSNGSTIGVDVNGCTTPWFGGLAGSVNLSGAIIGYNAVTALRLNPQLVTSVVYGGVISDGSSAMTLTKTGDGTQTLTGANTYGGATTIYDGTLALSGASGSALNSAFTVRGGTLSLDNSGGWANRLADGTALSLGSLTLTSANGAGVANETVGATTFAVGGKVIINDGTTAGDQTTLAMGAVTRSAGAAIDFVGTGGTLGGGANSPNITSTGAFPSASNGILPWATVNGTQWAEDNAGSIRAYSGTFIDPTSAASDATKNAQLTGSGTMGSAKSFNSLNVIATGAGQSLSLSGNLTLTSGNGAILKSGTDAYTISGSGKITAGNQLIAHVDGGDLTISAPLDTSILNIAKGGTGNLILSGTRATVMNGAISIAGGQLEFQGQSVNLSGLVSGAGGITVNLNPGQRLGLSYAQNKAQFVNVNNTFTGPIVVKSGVLEQNYGDPGEWAAGLPFAPGWTTANCLAGGLNNIELNGGLFTWAYIWDGRFLGPGPGQFQITGGISGFINKANTTFGAFNGDASYEVVWGSSYFKPDVLVLNDGLSGRAAATMTFPNKLDLNGSTRTVMADNATYAGALSGVIRTSSGTAGIIKTGVGELQLTAANTYNGGVIINGGKITLGNVSALGSSTGPVIFTGSSTLNLATFSPTVGSISSASGFGVITASGAVTLTVNQTNNTTFSGVIQNGSGTVSLLKTGSGTLTLSGTNTYSGATTVESGTLLGEAGGACASSSVTVTNMSGNTAAVGVSVTNSAMQWTCANMTFLANGIGAQLKFSFAVTPSTTLAPLRILNNLVFTGMPSVVVDPANVGAGKTYPLLVVEGSSCPASVPALSGVSGSLAWGSGAYSKTLYLTTPPNGTLISFF
jgi:autotransporter-associated beta strand protein